jgi:CDP-glycerol glycerophosphotransferase (TagB/SpsB family)
VELLCACDYIITDYSAIAVEAAILNKKTYYYLFDYEDYKRDNGLNIDLFEEMPGCVFKQGTELIEALEQGSYNLTALASYRKKYLPAGLGTSTDAITDMILENIL